MEYQLINPSLPKHWTLVEQVFYNRGFELKDIERAIELSRQRGCDITLDLVVLIQRKIDSKELTNFHMIGELQKLLGRKFL